MALPNRTAKPKPSTVEPTGSSGLRKITTESRTASTVASQRAQKHKTSGISTAGSRCHDADLTLPSTAPTLILSSKEWSFEIIQGCQLHFSVSESHRSPSPSPFPISSTLLPPPLHHRYCTVTIAPSPPLLRDYHCTITVAVATTLRLLGGGIITRGITFLLTDL